MTYSTVVSPYAKPRAEDDPREVKITSAGIARGIAASQATRDILLRHADELCEHHAAIEEMQRLLPHEIRFIRACAHAQVLLRMREHELRLDAARFGGHA